MEDKNYLICMKCKKYIPVHHPQAISWIASHESCREWVEMDENTESGTSRLICLSWTTPASAIINVTVPPEGYEPTVSELEDLAFSVKPEKDCLS